MYVSLYPIYFQIYVNFFCGLLLAIFILRLVLCIIYFHFISIVYVFLFALLSFVYVNVYIINFYSISGIEILAYVFSVVISSSL